jgi:hypothetical protein
MTKKLHAILRPVHDSINRVMSLKTLSGDVKCQPAVQSTVFVEQSKLYIYSNIGWGHCQMWLATSAVSIEGCLDHMSLPTPVIK